MGTLHRVVEQTVRRLGLTGRPVTIDPTPGARHHILIVLDSCRFDTFVQARPRHMTRLGEVQRRVSYATWTAPSHYNHDKVLEVPFVEGPLL